MRDRQMLEMLFGFTYRWEMYTPVEKRKYGYYVLPIHKAGEFIIKNWWWEPEIEPNDDMREMIINEMARFTKFLQIDNSSKNIAKFSNSQK